MGLQLNRDKLDMEFLNKVNKILVHQLDLDKDKILVNQEDPEQNNKANIHNMGKFHKCKTSENQEDLDKANIHNIDKFNKGKALENQEDLGKVNIHNMDKFNKGKALENQEDQDKNSFQEAKLDILLDRVTLNNLAVSIGKEEIEMGNLNKIEKIDWFTDSFLNI